MKRKIITVHEYPPISQRGFDWRAYRDGDEEITWAHGWGKTEAEAIEDLERLEWECAEEESEDDQRRLRLHAIELYCADLLGFMRRIVRDATAN
jgi:hypothetical protein